jgi:ubiquinol-cytochrome c reductase cytochrome b subunit
MSGRLVEWFKERWPIQAVLRWGLEEDIPGGSRFAYTLGSCALFLFLVQVATGVWQLLYYVPSTDHAYDSVMYLRRQVPLGWLVHGLHYWGANALLVVVGLHVARVFLWGAYKKPRELTWLSGVVLILLVAGLTFTGALLPWDELGYWAGEVGTSIAGTVPWIGGFLERFFRAGGAMGQLTVARFFTLHVAILPGLMALLVLIHLVAFRQFLSVGPWNPEKLKVTAPFWPDQVLKDLLVVSLLVVTLVALSAFVPAPVTGPADPIDTTYTPKPAWNFLFLYQALKVFKGGWEAVGTVGIPLALVALLMLVPFLDRREERRPLRRPVAMAAGVLFAGGILVMTWAGYFSHPGVAAGPLPPLPQPLPGPPAELAPSAKRGEELFGTLGCTACHAVSGPSGVLGPGLAGEGRRGRSRQWLAAQIRDPKAHNAASIMPPYAGLKDAQVDQLVDYMMALTAAPPPPPPTGAPGAAPAIPLVAEGAAPPLPLSGQQGPPGHAASMIGDPEHGALLFRLTCAACHGPQGTDNVPNPGSDRGTVPPLKGIEAELFNQDPDVFAANIDRFIQHGSIPKGKQPTLRMPPVGVTNTLTQQEAAHIEAYILYLNGVDRAEIRRPGISPPTFFVLTLAAFAITWTGMGAWWMRLRKGNRGGG